jgi:two-component system nitrogen regulation sensor histidine kinase NtrY|tara:strand:- start:6 stop:1799 length:1794 start_codon:yes stop_codon:yes gene_type:complete
MLDFIKKNKWIFVVFSLSLLLGILTFFTFINESFIESNYFNFQTLLAIDLALVLLFFLIIVREIYKLFIIKDLQGVGSKANIRYITFFSVSTLLPSILIAIFSLILFSVGLQKYFDQKITTAVNNSYDVAKNYVEETRNNIEADILLVAIDINRNAKLFHDSPTVLKDVLRHQRLIRRLDEIYLLDGTGVIKMSDVRDISLEFVPPLDKAFELLASENRPIKITDAITNRSSSLLKLESFIDTYLYVVKFLDPKIINYLKETEQAINFYYSVENKRIGIKITFALIYVIVVTLLLFLSITIGIKFASRFFRPIVNLIRASESISAGNLHTKVPIIEAEEEIDKLNKNFNSMIDRLKTQQDKLLLSERHEAWKDVARKLAHEIKNPLTPIQLSIDRLKEKYLSKFSNENDKENFENYLKTINRQIKDIEHLLNEFSDFARMPKPILKSTDIKEVVARAIDLHSFSNNNINFNFLCEKEKLLLDADEGQLNRVFINLIKNSIESIIDKSKKNGEFAYKIDIEIKEKNNYIYCTIDDNGIGFSDENLNKIVKPYFTTKVQGTGLGLAIVNKIVNDHDGKINFKTKENGARVEIILPKNVS